jgi:hypothetical protein
MSAKPTGVLSPLSPLPPLLLLLDVVLLLLPPLPPEPSSVVRRDSSPHEMMWQASGVATKMVARRV